MAFGVEGREDIGYESGVDYNLRGGGGSHSGDGVGRGGGGRGTGGRAGGRVGGCCNLRVLKLDNCKGVKASGLCWLMQVTCCC